MISNPCTGKQRTAYNTADALDFAAVKNLFDNFDNLGSAVNSGDEFGVDRLGIRCRTLIGTDTDANGAIRLMTLSRRSLLSWVIPSAILAKFSSANAMGNITDGTAPCAKSSSPGSTPAATCGNGNNIGEGVGDATLRTALASSGEGRGAALINTPFDGSVQQVIGLSPFKRVGNVGSGVLIGNATDAVKFNDMYYIYEGTLPHISKETTPDDHYRCIGLLNGWPITHTRNWGIVSDGKNQTSAVEFMLDNLPPDSTVLSDMKPIHVAALQLTLNRTSAKFKGVRFAPFFAAGQVVLPQMFNCTRSGLVFEDCAFDKPPLGTSVTSVFRMTDTLNCQFSRNVCTGTAGTIGKFWEMYNVKESSWSNNRIDIDPEGETGIVWDFNYCVNNTIDGGYYAYAAILLNFSNAPHPTSRYHTEGLYVANIDTANIELPIKGTWVTALFISNFQFDFCSERFFEFTNGGHCALSNGWFANKSTSTQSVFAVVAAGEFTGLTLSNVHFINNTGDNSKQLFSANPRTAYGLRAMNCVAVNFSLGTVLGTGSQLQGLTLVNEGETVGVNNAVSRMRGLGLEILNKNAWNANAYSAYVALGNAYGAAMIRAENGSLTNRIGVSLNVLYEGKEVQSVCLSDYTIRLPVLPTMASAAGVNGLYAGSDGIVRINR